MKTIFRHQDDATSSPHVPLAIEEYQKLTEKQKSITDLLAMPEAVAIEFEPPRLTDHLYSAANLT